MDTNRHQSGWLNQIIAAAASLCDANPRRARLLVALACSVSRAAPHTILKDRAKTEKRFLAAITRVLGYAKHETLRKVDRYLHSRRPLLGQEQRPDHPDSVRVSFDLEEFRRDLLAMLAAEETDALAAASQATLDSVGYRDPWKLPAQSTLDFIARRANLLRDVPDEIWQQIKDQIAEGLNKGEPIRQIAKRIEETFSAIEEGRATVIAQAETAAAYSFSSDKAMRAAGIKYKQWFHTAISKVPRPDHLAIHRLIVPIDEPYPVGSPQLMFPHDPNGAPEDVINCACMSLPAIEQEFDAQQKLRATETEESP